MKAKKISKMAMAVIAIAIALFLTSTNTMAESCDFFTFTEFKGQKFSYEEMNKDATENTGLKNSFEEYQEKGWDAISEKVKKEMIFINSPESLESIHRFFKCKAMRDKKAIASVYP